MGSYSVYIVDFGENMNIELNEDIEKNTNNKENNIYEKSRKSIVSIYVSKEKNIDNQGSGFIYKDYIITNYHVIEPHIYKSNTSLHVKYYNSKWDKLNIVGYDNYNDIAVLTSNKNIKYPNLEISEKLPKTGQKVFSYGSPNNLQNTLTIGHISGTEREMETVDNYKIPDIIQTTTVLDKGSSGGPLMNMKGEVIGVNRASLNKKIGMSISGRLSKQIIDEIIKTGHYETRYLGIETKNFNPINNKYSDKIKSGVVVLDTTPGPTNSILKKGDIITHIDSKKVYEGSDISRYINLEKTVGQKVTISVIRNGKSEKFNVNIGGIS